MNTIHIANTHSPFEPRNFHVCPLPAPQNGASLLQGFPYAAQVDQI